MPLSIFHTADVHIGMAFRSYADLADRLIEARVATLKRLVEQASERKCELFVVAGDLFNTITAKAGLTKRVAEILSDFAGVVLVLPGNHDFYSPKTDTLWQPFQKAANANVVLLGEERPYDLREHGLDAAVYPGPCAAKHSKENAIGWISEDILVDGVAHHICVAHGSVEGLSLDAQGQYFHMPSAELDALPVDVVLLGHTHRCFPETTEAAGKVFMPGTPEPDGLDCKHGGTAWHITLGAKAPKAELVESLGEYRFLRDEAAVSSAADVDDVAARLEALDADKTLLELTLTGRVNQEAQERIEELSKVWQKAFVWLELNTDNLRREIDAKVIEAEFPKGSFASNLLLHLAQDGEDAEALQVAHELVQKARVEP